MKKIITLICFIGMMQNGFAKQHPYAAYYNYTQNTGGGGYDIQNLNVTANLGDSIVFDAYVISPSCMMGCYPNQWYLEGDSIPNSSGEFLSVIINQYGTYSAYMDCFVCTGYIYFNVNNATGIPSLQNINFLNVYPTTVTSSIAIQLNSIKTNDVEISFFDMNGRQLKNDFYKNVAGEFIKNENTEALSNGMYFLRIKTGEGVVEKKFVKL